MEKKTLLALVAAVVLGAGAFFALRAPERGQRKEGAQARPIAALKAADITQLELTNEKQEKTTLTKKPEGWRITSIGDQAADQGGVKTVVDALEKMSFADVVTEQKSRYGDLGVEDGRGQRVTVKGVAGATVADFYLGKAVGGFTMVRPFGKDEVWQASGFFPYMTNREARNWRDHLIFDLNAADIDKLTVEAGTNKVVFDKLASEPKEPGKDGDAAKQPPAESHWKVAESTGDAPKASDVLDINLINGAIQSLATLRAADFADGKKLEETGLDKPVGKLTVAGKKSGALLIGTTNGDDTFVKSEANAQIYTVKKYSLDRLNRRPADFRDKTLVKLKETDLAAIELAVGGESLTLTFDGSNWKGKGKPTDDGKTKIIAGSFENLVGSGFADEKDPAKNGLGAKGVSTVTLSPKTKGPATVLKVGSLSKDGSEYYVQRVGSPDIVMLKKFQVDRFLKKAADLTPSTAAPPGHPGPGVPAGPKPAAPTKPAPTKPPKGKK